LLLNVHICGYLLYCRYCGRKPAKWFYIPFVFIAIVWAISIHTVTAFLYVGLGGRHFWNSAIVGPRFLASAFTAGPALIILAMQVVRRVTATPITGEFSSHSAVGRRATPTDLDGLARYLPELNSVPVEAQKDILNGAIVLDAQPGDVLLRQGNVDKDAFFVLKGRVVVKRQESGRLRVTRSVGPGEQFGEISALGGTPRAATAIAEEPTLLLRLTADSLRKLMKHPRMNKIIRSRMSERLMITDRALMILRSIVQVSMLINVFLLANEIFKEFYTRTAHVASAEYLFLGLHGHHALVPWIWTAVVFNLVAMFLLVLPISRSLKWLNVTCVLSIVGIWIEKGMGLVIPGFIPTPLGALIEYTPSLNETLVCIGIWAFGLLCYTIFLRMSVPILQGQLSKANEGQTDIAWTGDSKPRVPSGVSSGNAVIETVS
jgi:CRP-like cAMP-binding protein